MKRHLLAVGLLAALAGPQAHAANSDSASLNGSGDVILAMRNFDSTESLFWDLSVGANDLTATDFYNDLSLSFSISNATVSSWIGANASKGPLTFNLFGLSEVLGASSNPFLPPEANPAVGGVVTVGNLALQDSGLQVRQSVDSLQQFINAGLNPAGFPDNGVLITDNPANNAFFGKLGHGENLFGMPASGKVDGPTLAFYFVQQDPNASGATQASVDPIATQLGSFTLTQDALTYAPVPVPAAVWLFGSVLAGLLGMRRRG